MIDEALFPTIRDCLIREINPESIVVLDSEDYDFMLVAVVRPEDVSRANRVRCRVALQEALHGHLLLGFEFLLLYPGQCGWIIGDMADGRTIHGETPT